MKQPPISPACRIAPGLEADPVALRLAALSAKLAPSAKVLITTSEAIGEVPEGALLSAQNKLAKLGVDSPTVFQWVSRHEQQVDWNKVKTEADLRGVVSTRFAERAQVEPYLLKLNHQSDAAAKQVTALERMAEHDPEAANTLRQYQGNPAQHWGSLVGYVNELRAANAREWQTYLTQGNEEYSKDPYWQDLAWDIVDGALTSDRNHGLGTTIHLNQGILAELRQSINGKTQLVSLAANYGKLQVEFAKASAAEVVTTASKREWVYIPSKAEDPVNFEANVQKLKDLSCSSWCTKTFNAEPYLSRGGAWLLTEGSRTIAQIRLVGDKIQEIQGVKNDKIIPPEAGPDIEDLLAAHPELNGVNLWRAKNPGATPETLERLSQAEEIRVREAVAAHPNTPAATLTLLAADPELFVRKKTAGNPHTPVEALQLLAGDNNKHVRLALLENPALTPALYDLLSKDGEIAVRAAVAMSSTTPAATLVKLASDPNKDVRKALLSNHQLPPAAMVRLAQDRKFDVRLMLAKRADLAAAAAEILVKDRTAMVREELAKHEDLPTAVFERLAADEQLKVRLAVVANRETPATALDLLAKDSEIRMRVKVAEHKNTAPATLAALAGDVYQPVRCEVATHSKTPPEALTVLAHDKDYTVRTCVARNANTPVTVLENLAADTECYVRGAAAANPRQSAKALAILGRDSQHLVRHAVAANPNTLAATLDALAKDKAIYVRETVAANPNTSAATLDVLAKDQEHDVRENVARNPFTAAETLNALFMVSQSEERQILRAIAQNRSTPPEVLEQLSGNEDYEIRHYIAANRNTPAKNLIILAADESDYVRSGVAGNQAAPQQVLESLVGDDDCRVRIQLGGNPAAGEKILSEIAKDKWCFIRAAVARNPSVTQSIQIQLARDEDKDVKMGLAFNLSACFEALSVLVNDADRGVRLAATQHPTWQASIALPPTPEPTPAPEPVIVQTVAPQPEQVEPAPEPKELVFDKKRKNQLVFNFSLSGEGVEAFYDPKTDTTVFLQDKIATVERATALFFHETTGHRNVTLFATTPEGKAELAAILKSAEPQLMTELPGLLKATGHKSLADLKQDYGFGDTEEGKTAVLGELLARHAEKLADTEAPTWWELLANKVEVWMAKHLGTRLGEDAITTWLARLPARLPAVEIELERFGAYPEGYTQQYQAPRPQAPTYHPPRTYGHEVA